MNGLSGVLRSVWVGAAVMTLPSCGIFKTELDKCYEPREYQEAKPGPRARVPEGLEPIGDDAWVPIPYGETNNEPTPEGYPCLIEPPDYRVPD